MAACRLAKKTDILKKYKEEFHVSDEAFKSMSDQCNPLNSFIEKNFLSCGNHEAAENTAVICSLLASCKASQVNPREWFTDIIAWLPYYTRDKGKDLKELLPNYWKLRNSKEI